MQATMEQIADMNFMPPLPPVEMINIMNDQVNYINDDIANNAREYIPVEVFNYPVSERVVNVTPETFVPGEFLYVDTLWERAMLQNGWLAVEQLALWDFMKQEVDSYAWSDAPEVSKIMAKMQELGYDGHSGSTFGLTMRHLQYIAQHSEHAYINFRNGHE